MSPMKNNISCVNLQRIIEVGIAETTDKIAKHNLQYYCMNKIWLFTLTSVVKMWNCRLFDH